MPHAYKGLGVAWGSKIDSITYTAAATVLNVTPGDQTFDKTAQRADHDDGDGEALGVYFYKREQKLKLRCTPSGASLAAAKAANVTPEVGDKVVLAFTGAPTYEDGEIAGNWICENVSKSRNKAAPTEFDLDLFRFPDNDISNDTPVA